MLLNAGFNAFETLNSANSSASSALQSILVLNGSLYYETCNVSSLKWDRNSAETISRCSMIQVLMFSGKSIQFIFRHLFSKRKDVVDSTLIHACRTLIRAVNPASLSLISLTVTSRPCKDQLMSLRWPNTLARYANITTNSSL